MCLFKEIQDIIFTVTFYRAGELAQPVKCLLFKLEDLNRCAQYSCNKTGTAVIPVLGKPGRDGFIPGAGWPAIYNRTPASMRDPVSNK